MHIGFDNIVPWWTVRAILCPKSAPMKRLREAAERDRRLCDATKGRRTRAIIVTDSNHVILSAIHPETLMPRLLEAREKDRDHEGALSAP